METVNAHSLLMTLSEDGVPFQVFLEKSGPFITHTDIYSLTPKLSYSFSVGVLLISKTFQSFFYLVTIKREVLESELSLNKPSLGDRSDSKKQRPSPVLKRILVI